MKKVFTSNLSSAWKDHVSDRALEAMKVGLIEAVDCLDLEQGMVIFPERIDEDSIVESRPDTSVNDLLSIRRESLGKWTERVECLEDAAEVIQDLYRNEKKAFMFCEAGYFKVGDKFLSRYDYIDLAGNLLLFIELGAGSMLDVARFLKASRSTRILGVVKVDVSSVGEFKGRTSLFLCDALDGDSVFLCPVMGGS